MRAIAMLALATFLSPGTPATAQTPNSGHRAALADQLQRIFLSSGIDMSVHAVEKKTGSLNFNKYPTLWLFGPINRPLVYKAVAEWQFPKKAKDVGFAGLDFIDKGDGARWTFDLSKDSLPNCDIQGHLCF